jgi:hypothetical protein
MKALMDISQNPEPMTPELQKLIAAAGAAEMDAMTFAFFGSWADFAAHRTRIQHLQQEASTECEARVRELTEAGDTAALREYAEAAVEECRTLSAPLEAAATDMDRVKIRAELSDEEVKSMVKGQMVQMMVQAGIIAL